MKKIRIERSLKLRREDQRGRTFNILSNKNQEEDWLNSFGPQKELLGAVTPNVTNTHNERGHIASSMTREDKDNEKHRVNIQYMPRKDITHSSSMRYHHIPKDNGIF